MEFKHSGFTYVLTDAGNTSEGRVVRFTKWNGKGQMVDSDIIQANNFAEAMHKIKGE